MTPTTASPHTAWSPGRSSSLTLSLAAPAGDVISHSDFALQCTCVYKPRSVTTLCMHATSQVLTCLWLKRLRVLLTLSLLVPSQRRVLKPSRRTNTFAAKGYGDLSVTAAKSACNGLITILLRFLLLIFSQQ